ncbi:hypothetical protein OESDEN_03203 [Oesophagostomum dentatum]|uniref:Uncharacterized protein n=1 Tax=Oesophagostomum dentatum TaxID=61180 RepID=A0A0B1TL48_OESDE|nr:hypothetical protein OESDEN_03203 [Oesophagostomum dentatum]
MKPGKSIMPTSIARKREEVLISRDEQLILQDKAGPYFTQTTLPKIGGIGVGNALSSTVHTPRILH